MVDRDVVGCNWIELPAGKYTRREPNNAPPGASLDFISKYKRILYFMNKYSAE